MILASARKLPRSTRYPESESGIPPYGGIVRRSFPAILTACGLLTCGLEAPGAGSIEDPPSESSGPVTPGSVFLRGEVKLISPLPLRIEERTGKTSVGTVDRFDDAGLYGEIGSVRWTAMKPADRFRIGRAVLDRARRVDPPGLAWLVFMLEATGADAFRDRAADLLIAAAGDEADAWLEEASRRAQELLEASAALAAASDAARFARGRPHHHPRGSKAWPAIDVRTSVEAAARLREAGEEATDGLGFEGVRTRRTIVIGGREVDRLARDGVRCDRWIDGIAATLGLPPGLDPFPGGVLVVEVADHDRLRMLAAGRFGHEVLDADDSIVFVTDDGPFIIMAAPRTGRIASLARVIDADRDPKAMLFAEEEVRCITRGMVAMLETRRMPPAWLVEGFGEAMASAHVPGSRIDPIRRSKALASIRGGRPPQWILDLDGDDPAFDPEGLGRDVAFIVVTRLLESGPGVIPGLVTDLKAGRSLDESFRRRLGVSTAAWFADTADWFRFND
ncbi:MAG: hypothetical protein CMJ27_14565 [Phycisphaerae bacterium]|nr:hypothetical protein [Phycisphaerae bacterium]